jgi:hypothetical protein
MRLLYLHGKLANLPIQATAVITFIAIFYAAHCLA